jgi:adenine deaminase
MGKSVPQHDLADLIAAAGGDSPVDLVLCGGTVVDVLSGSFRRANVAVHGDRIVGVGSEDYEGERVLDCAGKLVAPGLIDGHIHLESSLVAPWEFARAAASRGTTTVVADAHEIANVCGKGGVRFMAKGAADCSLDVLLAAPSCVPASHLDTSGAELGARDVAEMLAWPEVVGLGEVMNFPGVLAGDPEVLAKLQAARGMPIDGHAPGLTGPDLQAYVAAGPDSDHECTTLAEAEEKLAAGMWIMIREGTAAQNLTELLPVAFDPRAAGRCMLVSDDLAPNELRGHGHIDRLLRLAVRNGLSPLDAIRLATANPACRFGLRDRGAVRAGLLADLVVFEDLEEFAVTHVIKRGREVSEYPASAPDLDSPIDTCHIGYVTAEAFSVPAPGGSVRVIGMVAGQIVTQALQMELPAEDGRLQADPERDVAKIAVIERHGRGGGMGVGFVKGLGLRQGAIASTVSHDSHNLIVAGLDDRSMATACRAVADAAGGYAAVPRGGAAVVLPLPIGGLMSDQPIDVVVRRLDEVIGVAHSMGCKGDPFATLAFLALPVIPELKITDKGLVDVGRFEHVPLAGGGEDG